MQAIGAAGRLGRAGGACWWRSPWCPRCWHRCSARRLLRQGLPEVARTRASSPGWPGGCSAARGRSWSAVRGAPARRGRARAGPADRRPRAPSCCRPATPSAVFFDDLAARLPRRDLAGRDRRRAHLARRDDRLGADRPVAARGRPGSTRPARSRPTSSPSGCAPPTGADRRRRPRRSSPRSAATGRRSPPGSPARPRPWMDFTRLGPAAGALRHRRSSSLATFVLLFLMTGSLVLPIKALLHQRRLARREPGRAGLGLPGRAPRVAARLRVGRRASSRSIPLLLFAFGFGLSMDYEVFLLSRIKELHEAGVRQQRGGRAGPAAVRPDHHLGGACSSSSCSPASSPGELLVIKETGVALAVAVAIDATLVRMLLVPATMTLLGRLELVGAGAAAPLARPPRHHRGGRGPRCLRPAHAALVRRAAGGVGRRPVRAARGPGDVPGTGSAVHGAVGFVRENPLGRRSMTCLGDTDAIDRLLAPSAREPGRFADAGGLVGVAARGLGAGCCTGTSPSATAATGSGCGRRRLPR